MISPPKIVHVLQHGAVAVKSNAGTVGVGASVIGAVAYHIVASVSQDEEQMGPTTGIIDSSQS